MLKEVSTGRPGLSDIQTLRKRARQDAAADKRDAAYAVAKEKCDAFSSDAKDRCLTDAKARYGKS